ncbi:hypothetical protein, partial [Nocardia cyriacigeorgica]|uniref:hypothetical protein n=1 Tax=Nocardia cyriacigeorgica TaxID=135487 RepID=UPI002457638D
EFATEVAKAGIAFVGPTPQQLRIFGDKHTARETARATGSSTQEVVAGKSTTPCAAPGARHPNVGHFGKPAPAAGRPPQPLFALPGIRRRR